MTTPSIPDLIAALEEHDAAMTSSPWRSGSYAADVLYDGDREDLPDEVMSCPDINRVRAGTEQNHRDAAGIAWFGTHRGALVERLREVERLRADRDRLAAEVERLRAGEECHVARPGEGTLECGMDRKCLKCRCDEARAEADRLRAILSLFGLNADAPIDAIASASVTLVEDQRGKNAQRLAALSEVFSLRATVAHLQKNAGPDSCAALLADAIAARDSAVNDTAERIAEWLDGRARDRREQDDYRGALQTSHYASAIRAGAWRGQNGGG